MLRNFYEKYIGDNMISPILTAICQKKETIAIQSTDKKKVLD